MKFDSLGVLRAFSTYNLQWVYWDVTLLQVEEDLQRSIRLGNKGREDECWGTILKMKIKRKSTYGRMRLPTLGPYPASFSFFKLGSLGKRLKNSLENLSGPRQKYHSFWQFRVSWEMGSYPTEMAISEPSLPMHTELFSISLLNNPSWAMAENVVRLQAVQRLPDLSI